MFVDVTRQMELKTRMLATHASQHEWLREHHGMGEYIDAMRQHAAQRRALAGTTWAEAFVRHHGHSCPRNDLLREQFP